MENFCFYVSIVNLFYFSLLFRNFGCFKYSKHYRHCHLCNLSHTCFISVELHKSVIGDKHTKYPIYRRELTLVHIPVYCILTYVHTYLLTVYKHSFLF